MDKEKYLKKIFLSASIPDPDRDPVFYVTADIIAIRDAVKALAAVVIPNYTLVWGGHPSITPLIRFVLERMDSSVQVHVTLYQSLFFEKDFPEDNASFGKIILTGKLPTLKQSVDLMRLKMMSENKFAAGIFIGGMEGIFEEYKLFRELHPRASVFPVASTGAAANILYERTGNDNVKLKNEYAYMALFKSLFPS
jgi:hypothetical protein